MNRRQLLIGVAATAFAGVSPRGGPSPIWSYSAFVKRLPQVMAGMPASELVVGQVYNIVFDGTDWLIEGPNDDHG
jgi:hypothetical protein